MSDAIGPIAVTDGRQDGPPRRHALLALTQQLVDEEVRRIVDEAERDVVELLERERDRLEALAGALLERETLDQPEAYEVAGVEVPEVDVEAGGQGDGRNVAGRTGTAGRRRTE